MLSKRLAESHSRTEVQSLISEGLVTVNGRPAKTSHRLRSGEKIEVRTPPKRQKDIFSPENIPLDIIYKDEALLVINKPAGLVTHPAGGNWAHTLVNALLGYSRQIARLGPTGRFGIVHRLDKGTSGLIVVAKNEVSQRNLSNQFKNRTVKKEYLALVKGIVGFDRGLIEAPLGRSLKDRKKMAVTWTNGRAAITRYEVLERFSSHTLVKLMPRTGRTHQLRVHLSHLGYPIVGDKTYSRAHQAQRMALHARKLGFFHPVSKQYLEFEAEVPRELKEMIKAFKNENNT